MDLGHLIEIAADCRERVEVPIEIEIRKRHFSDYFIERPPGNKPVRQKFGRRCFSKRRCPVSQKNCRRPKYRGLHLHRGRPQRRIADRNHYRKLRCRILARALGTNLHRGKALNVSIPCLFAWFAQLLLEMRWPKATRSQQTRR